MVKIEWCLFHSKIFIFGQVMVKNFCKCPYLDICILAILQPFLGQLDWIILWELRRLFLLYYLSIGEKSKLWCLFLFCVFFVHFWWENGHGHYTHPEWSVIPNPAKKLARWVFWDNHNLEIIFLKFSTVSDPLVPVWCQAQICMPKRWAPKNALKLWWWELYGLVSVSWVSGYFGFSK